ncbi:MAG: FMN-binding protein [Acidimicrobiales bacterium]
MRRAPLVITGTLVGLAGVLSFRSAPATLSLGALGSATTPTTTAPRTTVAATPTTVPSTATPSPSTVTTATPTTVAAMARLATGATINYYFGTMSVKVSADGSRITAVSIASLNDGGNPRSQYIDQQAIPMLIQQVMAAQSARIQGVSGATYTSEGFYTSLLGALKQLGLK